MASITTDEWIIEMMKDMGLNVNEEKVKNDNSVDYEALADIIIQKMNNVDNDNEELDSEELENESEENEHDT